MDLDRGTAFSTKSIHSYKILMALWLTIEIGHFLHGIIRMDIYVEKGSKVLSNVDIITPWFIRLHAIVLLIESFVKRSDQVELLDKMAEIENVFVTKFHVKIDEHKLQRTYRNHLIFWLLRIAAIIGCLFLGRTWGRVYYILLYMVPFYTSTLMYAQLLAYIDTIHYCIEILIDEVGQFSMRHVPHSAELTNAEKRTFVFTFEKIERLRDLRHGFQLVWQASILVNHYVRWSLPIGINNEFITLINDLYWICLILLNPMNFSIRQTLICIIWASVNLSCIYQTSSTCDRTMGAVSFCSDYEMTLNLQ